MGPPQECREETSYTTAADGRKEPIASCPVDWANEPNRKKVGTRKTKFIERQFTLAATATPKGK